METPPTLELRKLLNILQIISLQQARTGFYRRQLAGLELSEGW